MYLEGPLSQLGDRYRLQAHGQYQLKGGNSRKPGELDPIQPQQSAVKRYEDHTVGNRPLSSNFDQRPNTPKSTLML